MRTNRLNRGPVTGRADFFCGLGFSVRQIHNGPGFKESLGMLSTTFRGLPSLRNNLEGDTRTFSIFFPGERPSPSLFLYAPTSIHRARNSLKGPVFE